MKRSAVNARRRARRLIRNVKVFLESPEKWKFRYADLRKGSPLNDMFDGNTSLAGLALTGFKHILVDYHHDVIATVMHECLHAMYPKWKEGRVRHAEALIMKYMRAHDAVEIHRLFGRRLPK